MVDFPNGPALDETFTTPDGAVYTWDGVKWVAGGGAATAYLPLAGGTMLGFITHNADPIDPLHSVPKRYMDSVVGTLVAGVDLIGFYDATLSTIRWNTDQSHTGNTLPTPAAALKGHFLICAVAGSAPPSPATVEAHSAGDWLICDGVSAWLHIYISTRIDASQVPTNPAVAAQADVQAALEIMAPTTGATMTGALSLAAAPTSPMHAATKSYVDGAASGGLPSTGATPPPAPIVGQLWFDPAGAQLYIWFNDGTSSQWVATSNN